VTQRRAVPRPRTPALADHEFGYGNEDIPGPIDQLWLNGPLRITPREQVELVHHMLSDELPVKKWNVELLWRVLEIESGPDYPDHGKIDLGWLVG